MTVNNSANKVIAAGNGVQTVFGFAFIAVQASDLEVIVTDSAGNMTTLAPALYTAALNPTPPGQIWSIGGTVTYPLVGSPIPIGSTITIARELSLTQLVALGNQGNEFPSAVETGLDLLEMQLQQVSELFQRAIVAPIVDPSGLLPLPPAAQRANQGMGFDSQGNPVAMALPASGAISTAMQPVVGAASLALGRAAFGLGAMATEDIGAGLQDDGAGNVRSDWPLVSDSTPQAVTSAFHLQRHIATGPITYTLPRANTLWNGFGFWIEVVAGGAVTVAINAADRIEGQSSGTSGSLTIGSSSFITTDAANSGTWRVETGFIGISGFITLVTNSAGTPTLKLGTGAGSGDDSAGLIARALSPASGLLNSHAIRDETSAIQNVTGAAFSGYSSFDSAFTVTGVCTTPMNHIRNFQARSGYNCTGTVNEVAGLWCGHTSQAGTVAALYGVHVVTPTILGGNITASYAFHSDTLSGAGSNWFLFGGNNPSALAGQLYVGGLLSSVNLELANIKFDGSTQRGLVLYDSFASAGSTTAQFMYRSGSIVGSITTTLSNTAFNTSSDERLKDFAGELSAADAIAIIKADPVRRFTWKVDGTPAVGWGAQTSYRVSTDLATPGNDKEPGEEGFQPWGIDQAKRTPYLWAALQGALDHIDAIEAENAALKRRLDAIEARLAAAGI